MNRKDRQLRLDLAHVAVDALFDLTPAGVAKAATKGVLRRLEKRGKGKGEVDPGAVAEKVAAALEPFFAQESDPKAVVVAHGAALRLLENHAPRAERVNDLRREPTEIVREIRRQGSRELDGLDPLTEIPLVEDLLRHTYQARLHQEAVRSWLAADLERRQLVEGETVERIDGKVDLVVEHGKRLSALLEEVLERPDEDEEPPTLHPRSSPAPVRHPAYESEEHERLVTQLVETEDRRAALIADGEDVFAVNQEILEIKRRLRSGPELLRGDILAGRFQLFDVLGRGGFATVWRAVDRHHQRRVAVKVLRGEHSNDRSRVARFFRGARQMAGLDHPGIVRVIEERGEDGGYHFFAMEYAEGGDLRRAVLDGKLTRDEAVEKVLEIGEALQHAHDRGLVHRDVKPSNILLFADGRPKLTDFDLVRAADTTGGTHTRAMLGTFLYAAPEVLADAKTADQRADVFSLGMTLVFTLHGADLPLDLLRRVDDFVGTLDCSLGMRQAVRRATGWEVEGRQRTVVELATAVREGLRETETEQSQAPKRLSPRSQPPQQRVNCVKWVEDVLPQVPEEDRSDAVLDLAREVHPLSAEDLKAAGALAWALDYHPARSEDESHRIEAGRLRRALMQPLRERRPPPAVEELPWASIPSGTFKMGSRNAEGQANERPQHEVTLSPFRLGTTPVTCHQIRRLLPDHPGEDDHPAIGIDWYTAYAYAAWLERRGRLPTEAEWEYACRAGTSTRYWSGDEEEDLARVGWYLGNSGGELHLVAEKPANPFGLHDMHGLVYEWIADRYGGYPAAAQTDPWGTPGGGGRVVRGGSYWNEAMWARSACRDLWSPGIEFRFLGFRVVLPAAPSAEA